jgi:hypothetical protein
MTTLTNDLLGGHAPKLGCRRIHLLNLMRVGIQQHERCTNIVQKFARKRFAVAPRTLGIWAYGDKMRRICGFLGVRSPLVVDGHFELHNLTAARQRSSGVYPRPPPP